MYFCTYKIGILSFEYFIARKILKNEIDGKKVSLPIVRISIICISLAMLVNIITIAVVKGFQHEVRDKVIGFGSHAVITKSGQNTLFESDPIQKDNGFKNALLSHKTIKHIQAVAYKAGLLQSNITHKNRNDQQEIQGVLIKGVEKSYDWAFFKSHLVSGRIPNYHVIKNSDEVLISKKIASDLHFKLNDTIAAFFVKNKPVKKKFTIVGLYETGYEELDKKIVIADLKHIQKLNDWGIQASISIDDTLKNNQLIIRCEAIGGNGNYRYDWGKGYNRFGGFLLYPLKDTTIRVIVSDYAIFLDGHGEKTSIPDTASLKINVTGEDNELQPIKLKDGLIAKKYTDDAGYTFDISAGNRLISCKLINGNGSNTNYIGGYECNIGEWDELAAAVSFLKKKCILNPTKESLKVTSIIDSQSDIFTWLAFLDINVWIILLLMIVIGVINMGSALLVMILVKTNFIGLLKALGASDWSVRKIFLYQVGFLIVRGMFWGNLIGIGLCLIQVYFEPLKLDATVYYLSAVPIEINLYSILILNMITLLVCVLSMVIPSYIITRISPAKSIKFN